MLKDVRSMEWESSERQLDSRWCEPIIKDEIREAIKKMANRKVEGPDQIPVEVLKCLDEKRLKWLTRLFNSDC